MSELWLATLVGTTGLSCPLGISRFVLYLFDPMTCTTVQWSQRTTIDVIIYDDSLLGDWGKSSFPRMHMAYSSYTPCNSNILAAFSPFSCFGFLCGGQRWSGQTKGCQTLYSKHGTNLVADKIFTFSNGLIYNQALAWFIVFEFTCLVIQRQLFLPSSLTKFCAIQ